MIEWSGARIARKVYRLTGQLCGRRLHVFIPVSESWGSERWIEVANLMTTALLAEKARLVEAGVDVRR